MDIQKPSDYISARNHLISQENKLFLGEKLELNENESKLNTFIINLKCEELHKAYIQSDKFLPKQHFFQSKTEIEKSKIFNILKRIPKGHSLHTHLLASASVDFLIKNITYKENAYGKFINDKFKVKFMKPEDAKKDDWISLNQMRKDNENFDSWLKLQFSICVSEPEKAYRSIEAIWTKFKNTFSAVYDMLSYKPAFEECYYQCLKEHYEDKVMHIEFKATPMPLYDLTGTIYKPEDFFQTMLDIEKKFKKDHKDFLGAKYIHSIYRGISIEDLRKDLKEISEMKKKFPKLIIGLDFVGFEEEGHNLVDFYQDLNDFIKDDFHFFFHAGETNWYGHTDMNLVDAILMKSKRIGHGFALSKHPMLMDLVLKQNIGIELCPISNQVLFLTNDPRNHPVIPLMAKDFPVIICNDDPSVWEARGLSYDWYIAFMGMTPKMSGLKFLKQLALNSIKYSILGEDENRAMELWIKQWNDFVSDMVKEI